MTNKSTKTKSQTLQGDGMAAAMALFNPALATAWVEMMTESARFVSDRLQQDMETQRALLNCKTPAELLQVQTEFYQNAMEQYAAEANKLMEMMTQAAASHKRGYDDVPL
ncbi:phasin family protein [Aliishimia ponticola]|uniref:Phasin family protein n=1 Tax=Aliishimia ponticola TaxID=2499833 RepID=A0A4S4N9T6_9RHOB|nr:phasin family protein [Aliishimia ponticola]THH36024.1 phasin family protein [Aliishimia ponticola]